MNYFDNFFNKNKIIPKISYENLQDIINNNNNDDICIINTLNSDLQNVLIKYTIKSYDEEDVITGHFDVDVDDLMVDDHKKAAAPKVAIDWSIFEKTQCLVVHPL